MRVPPVKCQLEVIRLSKVLPFPSFVLFDRQRDDVRTSDGSEQGCLEGSMSHDSIMT